MQVVPYLFFTADNDSIPVILFNMPAMNHIIIANQNVKQIKTSTVYIIINLYSVHYYKCTQIIALIGPTHCVQ